MTLLVGMTFSLIVSIFFVFKDEKQYHQYNKINYNGYSLNHGDDDQGGHDYDSSKNNVEYQVEQDLANSILSFQTEVFFLALLPPILFNSGYQLQRELFYRHLAPISLFACVGTCISGVCTGGILVLIRQLGGFGAYFHPTIVELLTFGALIAATDTVSVVGIFQAKQVDPHLFSLVFGESALNDAVSIVLFKTLSTFLIQDAFGDSSILLPAILKFFAHLMVQATCSPLLGMFYAFCMALAFKTVDLRQHPLLELSLYMMPMYIPYMLSEALELSGMITIFFTGMFAKRYMEPNVSDSTKQYAQMLFKLFAFLAETCIFLELGLSVFGLSRSFQWRFVGWALLTALIGRAASIYPLAAIYNLSLTRVVTVCHSCAAHTADDTSISTLGSKSAPGESCAGGSSLEADGGDGGSGTIRTRESSASWSSRRETPKKHLDKRIPLSFMHMLTFAGLRGAVAYACARDFPNLYGHRDAFVTTTMVIVLFTIVIMGGGTVPLMDHLNIRTNVDEKEYMRKWHTQRKLKGRFHRFEYHYIYRLVVRRGRGGGEGALTAGADTTERVIKQCMTPIMDNTGGDNMNHAFDYSLEYDEENYEFGDYASGRLSYQAKSSNPRLDSYYMSPAPLGSSTPMHDDSNVFNLYEDEGLSPPTFTGGLVRSQDHLPFDFVPQQVAAVAGPQSAAVGKDDELDDEDDDGNCSLREDYRPRLVAAEAEDDDQSSLGSYSFRGKPSPDRSSATSGGLM